MQPEEILNAKQFNKDIAPRLKRIISGDGQGKRTDRLKTICTRLMLYVTDEYYKVEDNHKDNIIAFLLNEEMDAALRFNVHRHIANAKTKPCRNLIRDARLAHIILAGL